MKYKVGDKVRIVSDKSKSKWWNSSGRMDKWIGKVMTIKQVLYEGYHMEEDSYINDTGNGGWYWYENMIECAVSHYNDLNTCDSETLLLEKGKVEDKEQCFIRATYMNKHGNKYQTYSYYDKNSFNFLENTEKVVSDLVNGYNNSKPKEEVEEVKFDFEEFKKANQRVHCETERDAELFLFWLKGKGIEWKVSPFTKTFWDKYKENTTYGITFGDLSYGCVYGNRAVKFTKEMLADF